MNKRVESSRALTFSNAFGALGYLSLIFQWSWSLLILAYPLLVTHSSCVPEPKKTVATEPLDFGIANPIVTVVVIGVTIFVLVMTVLIVAKLPKTIGRQGARVTHGAARKIMPLATRKKIVTKKQRRQLSYRLVLLFKLIAIIVPIFALVFAQPIASLDHRIVWIVALFCGAWTILYFGIQQLIARIGHVKLDAIW